MKKRLGFAALALAIAAILASALCAWRGGSTPIPISAQALPLDSGRDLMRVQIDALFAQKLTASQSLTARNRTGQELEEIVLRVLANGAEMMGTGARSVDVAQVCVDGEAASFAFDEEDPTVLRIAYRWAAGEEITLTWQAHATLSDGITLVQLPTLSVYEDGAWRTDTWDALVQGSAAQAFDLDVSMARVNGVDVSFGGALLVSEEGAVRARMLGARDAALLVSRGRALRYRESGGVKMTAVAPNLFAAEKLLDQAETALSSLAAAGFAYPFPSLTIAQMDTGYADGYATTGLIALSAEKNAETQLRRMTRLIARQTFGVLVGNDPWQSPWLSYSLASTAEMLAYRQRKGEAAYEARFFEDIEIATRLTRPYGVTVGAGVDRFGGDTEMTQVLRDQGAAMMLGVEQALGSEAFLSAMEAYISENAHEIADRQALEEALESVGGGSFAGYLEDELSF